MGRWWVKFPVYNVELEGDIRVGSVWLRPLPDHRELCSKISKIRDSAKPFIQTADAIIELGERAEAPSDAWQEAWEVFRPVHEALRFLQQRDFRVSKWSLHATPQCEDASVSRGCSLAICTVPYEPRIQFSYRNEEHLLQQAANAWGDEELAGRTAFSYAVNCQHTALGVRVIETAYIQQWIAFEVLFNRWCDMDPKAPKDTEINRSIIEKEVRPAVRKALHGVVSQSYITGDEADALLNKGIRPILHEDALTKARAFLAHYGVTDVDNGWLQGCVEIRNGLMHGRRLTDIYEGHRERDNPSLDLNWRTLQVRELVNRYVMHLIGYEPDSWDFAESLVGFYVRKENGG